MVTVSGYRGYNYMQLSSLLESVVLAARIPKTKTKGGGEGGNKKNRRERERESGVGVGVGERGDRGKRGGG